MFTVRQPSGSFDRMLGDVSYPVYLFHWPAIILLRSMAVGTYLNRILYDLVAIGLVSLLSWIAWAAVDHPLNRIRAKWVNNRLL
jgi:peptidoglycan/LPS O-acetylase OafA/YrhL